jgi:hypothetical protein
VPLDPDPRRAISFRSVALGFLGVILICVLTPYNDYALNNSFFVGNNLPLGAVMLLFIFVVLINGPLNRFAPVRAFTSGEITVAFGMMLVSCALPSSGLMRYLPNVLVGPLRYPSQNREFGEIFEKLHLARWIFPSFRGKTPEQWATDPIATGYLGRWIGPGPAPYFAWAVPVVAWGVFLIAMYGALMCLITLVRQQWFENERLPLPLAQIELALIERPAPRRWLNNLLGARSFWITFSAVFALHIWRGLAQYFPAHVPDVPIGYDFQNLMGQPPWGYTEMAFKSARVFLAVVGVTYFVPSPVSISMWFFFLAWMTQKMLLGTFTGDNATPGEVDEHLGGLLAWGLAVIWIGRRHWRLIFRQSIRGEQPAEPRGRYLSHPFAFWGAIVCTVIMILWLWLAGAQLYAAIVTVIILLLLFMITTRIVAETGLIHMQMRVSLLEPWAQINAAHLGKAVSQESYYLGSMLQATLYDHREPMPVYASHALKIADQTSPEAERRFGRRFIALLMSSLLLGYVVSFASMLWTEYHYVSTKDVPAKPLINDWGADGNVRIQIVESNVKYAHERFYSPTNTYAHWTFGFVFTAFLAFMRLRFAWWPLHPVGYVMINSFGSDVLWFSILIGWICKALIVRFGGSRMYTAGKPIFLGLIVGESVAAGFWLIVGIVLSAMNLPYRPINIMPT